MKQTARVLIPKEIIHLAKRVIQFSQPALELLCQAYGCTIHTQTNLLKHRNRKGRKLEIGPGTTRIEGFETASISWNRNVDYVVNASQRLPFKDDSISLVYASHILEHIPWYQTLATLQEWHRIIEPNGLIEIFVPDGLLIVQTFVDAEIKGVNNIYKDGWYKFNQDQDPCVWANGRVFSYGDGKGSKSSPNWHLALFTERHLKKLLTQAGFVEIVDLTSNDVRGFDHGWINLGVRGRKPLSHQKPYS